MSPKNLSEELFKPRVTHPETSTLVRHGQPSRPLSIQGFDNPSHPGWYRIIDRLLWSWRGLAPQEIAEVLARIAASRMTRSDECLLDTVTGYRRGNWIFEWSAQAAHWQQQASACEDDARAGLHWLHAAALYSLASYPHLKEDTLAEQAQTLAFRAYEEATRRLPGEIRQLTFSVSEGAAVSGFLHQPPGVSAPYPTLLVCANLDELQCDHYRLFHDYLAPRGIAMLTLDVPSVGFSGKWRLDHNASFLHQQVLRQLDQIPWIDHTRVAAFGFRFGAAIALRLAYLEPGSLRAVACLGPVVHSLLTDAGRQAHIPDMAMDMLASRLGMAAVADSTLLTELSGFSLKLQGLLGRRCPLPLLAACWPNDPFSPEEESRLIVNSSASGHLLKLAPAPAMGNFERGIGDICRWIAARLAV